MMIWWWWWCSTVQITWSLVIRPSSVRRGLSSERRIKLIHLYFPKPLYKVWGIRSGASLTVGYQTPPDVTQTFQKLLHIQSSVQRTEWDRAPHSVQCAEDWMRQRATFSTVCRGLNVTARHIQYSVQRTECDIAPHSVQFAEDWMWQRARFSTVCRGLNETARHIQYSLQRTECDSAPHSVQFCRGLNVTAHHIQSSVQMTECYSAPHSVQCAEDWMWQRANSVQCAEDWTWQRATFSLVCRGLNETARHIHGWCLYV